MKLRQLHLILGVLNLGMFISGVVVWKMTTKKISSEVIDDRIRWTDNSHSIWYTKTTTTYDLPLILWVGSLILSLMHLGAFFLWRTRLFGIDSMSDRFGKRKDPSLRWIFYFTTTILSYLVIIGFPTQMYDSTVCLMSFLAVSGSTLFYLFDKINLPHVVISEINHLERINSSEDPDEENGLEGQDDGTELKSVGSDVKESSVSDTAKYRKFVKRFGGLDFTAWLVGFVVTLFVDVFFLIYNFTSDQLSLAPISFSIAVCVFVVYNLWSIIVPVFMYRKWSVVSHITNTISFLTITSMTYTTLFIIAFIGIYV